MRIPNKTKVYWCSNKYPRIATVDRVRHELAIGYPDFVEEIDNLVVLVYMMPKFKDSRKKRKGKGNGKRTNSNGHGRT